MSRRKWKGSDELFSPLMAAMMIVVVMVITGLLSASFFPQTETQSEEHSGIIVDKIIWHRTKPDEHGGSMSYRVYAFFLDTGIQVEVSLDQFNDYEIGEQYP